MAYFLARFEHPVVHEGGGLTAAFITELLVFAPTETSALQHALRVTQGDPGAITIAPTEKPHAPPMVEAEAAVEAPSSNG